MTLTEQWGKGELPDGTYYIELNDGNVIMMGYGKFAGWYNVKEVLAPVPTYGEYQALLSDQLAKQEGEEIIAELESKIEGLTVELHEVLSVLLKVSPKHIDWVKMNFPDYKEQDK